MYTTIEKFLFFGIGGVEVGGEESGFSPRFRTENTDGTVGVTMDFFGGEIVIFLNVVGKNWRK